MNPVLIILIILAVIIFVVEPVAGRIMMNKLSENLVKRNLEGFDKLRNNPLTKVLVKSVNLFYLDLNRAMAGHDDSQVLNLLKIAGKLRISTEQKEDICIKVFYYYLSAENKDGCRKSYRMLKDINPDNVTLDIINDTFVEGGYKYLEEILESYDNSPEEQKASQASLLAAMYENKGDKAKAKKYHEISERYINRLKKK